MSSPNIGGFSGSTPPSFSSDSTQSTPPQGPGGCHGGPPKSNNGSHSSEAPPPPPTKEDLVQFLMQQGMSKEEAEAKVEEMLAQGFQPGFQPPPMQNEESAA